MATIYTQARKFKVSFCAVCTSLANMPSPLLEMPLGAVTLVAFQVLTRDAEVLAPEMFCREFDRVKHHVRSAGGATTPLYYQAGEVLAA